MESDDVEDSITMIELAVYESCIAQGGLGIAGIASVLVDVTFI